jgi:clan AA aspartic protease (TIGR02281 family)
MLRRFYIVIICAFVAFFCVTQVSLSKTSSEATGNENWQMVGESVIYRDESPTKVKVIGNSVLIPVTLLYRGNQVDVQLLLDTGASATVINTEVADRLGINLNAAKKIKVQVVGGRVIDAHLVMLKSLTVGPQSKKNALVTVVPHEGARAKHDGLLGMDVLRDFKYRVDFDKELIIWE